jgi:SAM-dependent methyltransferase
MEDKIQELNKLAPWHIDVQISSTLTTAMAARDPSVNFMAPGKWFKEETKKIYPNGLTGKRFLDVACNCGSYCFWAKDLGALECFGFDIRKHWIDQAKWLLANRTFPGEGISFSEWDVMDMPKLNMEPFDITNFSGIFYHLPDPVLALQYASAMTKELMLFNSAYQPGLEDGFLKLKMESKERPLSGIHGISWLPTGPEVVKSILREQGFVEFKPLFQRVTQGNLGEQGQYGRLAFWASKVPGLLNQKTA